LSGCPRLTVRTDKENRPFISVVKGGESVPQLAEIFQLIASNNLVLATGHSSPEESLILVPEAKKVGVKHILITHATELGASRAQMEQMAELGAIIECVWMPQIKNKDKVAEYADLIKAIGAEHSLISSDLGQYLNPLHTDGMKAFILGLREQGVGDIGIDLMSRKNPARLLGLIE
jgi:predicted metal-dependent phosphotriesterase family hydrolase